MKKVKVISTLLVGIVVLAVMFSACKSNDAVDPQKDLLPQSFSVDIPNSISNNSGVPFGGRVAGSDTLNGNEVYKNLNTFIAVGETASKIVEGFINGIRKYNITKVISLTYTSDDDSRVKNLVVVNNVDFEGINWNYQLTISDANAATQADGGKALQIFWNTEVVKGIAIIKPYNCDRKKNINSPDALFRIDYSEAASSTYEKQMEVTISGLTLPSPLTDPYAINSLHMFAGKKGDVVDVRGNSNHPNATFFAATKGFNYAFVASGNQVADIGVAEVGLPASNLNSKDRKVLLKDNSVTNVFTKAVNEVFPGIDPKLVAAYLKNTAAPGYFNKKGFMVGGTSPGADWNTLAARLDAMAPYSPLETSNLIVKFK